MKEQLVVVYNESDLLTLNHYFGKEEIYKKKTLSKWALSVYVCMYV